jgi:thiamine-monophosphate kinase
MESRTEISEIGEFGLINRMQSQLSLTQNTTVLGIGDDAAVLDYAGEKEFIITSVDALVEGIHFDLAYVPLKHLGYKSMTVNFSDMAAMNGKPEQVLVTLGLSNRFSVEAVEELYEGMQIACDKYGVDLVGGDTTSSRSGLFISVTVIGRVSKETITYRKGASAKDLICVTGDLGAAFMGLQVLEREKQVFSVNPDMQPELDQKAYIVERQLKPEARIDAIRELKKLGIVPTSMIDISDGLASELLHLCNASGLGAKIYEEKLPVDKMTYDTAREFNLDPLMVQLNGGEDYELLFTITQDDYEHLRNHPDFTVIGYMEEATAPAAVLISKQGTIVPIQAQGWNHFNT